MLAKHPEAGALERSDHRPHEGFVVEARAEQFAAKLVRRAQIEGERGKAVLAQRLQAFVDFDLRCRDVRFAHISAQNGDQSIRLVNAGREQAARPVVFERTAEQGNAVGKQRGCQRIAGVAGILPAVKAEVDAAVPVDSPSGRCADGAHLAPPGLRVGLAAARGGALADLLTVLGRLRDTDFALD